MATSGPRLQTLGAFIYAHDAGKVIRIAGLPTPSWCSMQSAHRQRRAAVGVRPLAHSLAFPAAARQATPLTTAGRCAAFRPTASSDTFTERFSMVDYANPRPHLRLAYDANPLALLCEQAGGASSDGARRILESTPTALPGAGELRRRAAGGGGKTYRVRCSNFRRTTDVLTKATLQRTRPTGRKRADAKAEAFVCGAHNLLAVVFRRAYRVRTVRTVRTVCDGKVHACRVL